MKSFGSGQVPKRRRPGGCRSKRWPGATRASADSLKASEVARLLNIGLGRVRQRAAQRSVFVMPSTDRRLWFPRYQFTDDGELPGWAALCRELPEQADSAAVEYFLTRPHPDLAGGELTPLEWLSAGKPAEDVVVLAELVFGTC